MTGFTDQMRADFMVMKDIAQFTRVFPATRGQELERFAHQINRCVRLFRKRKRKGLNGLAQQRGGRGGAGALEPDDQPEHAAGHRPRVRPGGHLLPRPQAHCQPSHR